jgi:hypothetical protein
MHADAILVETESMKHPLQRATWILIAALAIAACNEGGSSNRGVRASAPAAGSRPADGTPTISMSSQSVLVGRELRAQPVASDPDGQQLTYTIENKPSWLSFASQSGEILGTPGEADVGTYQDIRIIVSDGQNQASVTFSVTALATASGRATLSWNAPTERTDGSPLTDLAGFRVYFGNSLDDLRYVIDVRDAGARSWVVDNLTSGTWYFAATALDTTGAESSRSNTTSKIIS